MYAEQLVTPDGRSLIRVTFDREGDEPDLPTIMVSYHVYTPEDYTLAEGQHVIEFLAAVDKDSLEPVQLTAAEKRRVLAVVTSKASEHDPDWEGGW